MRDDPSHIEEKTEEDGTHVYRGHCSKCHYCTVWLKNEQNAAGLLNRHRRTRAHKTNTASQHRYKV